MSDQLPQVGQLRLDAPSGMADQPNKRVPRHKVGQKFLKGPVPLDWLGVAAKQPGKAIHVAIGIWVWAGIKNSRQVAFSMSWLQRTFGVNRCSGYRGLTALEKVGLVSVSRHRGRKPLVTLLDLRVPPLSSANEKT
jgi:hypothetical protein